MRSSVAAIGTDAIFYGTHKSLVRRGRGSFAETVDRLGGASDELRIGLCIPMGGLTGIWGPSAMASARLAVAELNRDRGIGGKSCRLITVDADDHAPHLESILDELLVHGEIDALVGMHTSFVRQRIIATVHGRVPFVYTPLYEGERPRLVFLRSARRRPGSCAQPFIG